MIQFFAKHPTAGNLLMFIMIAAGVLSLGGLRKETFPDATPDEIEVRVVYPGATPIEVEETIIERLEDALDGTRDLKEMRSVAQSSVGTTILKMTDNGNYTAFRNEIDNAVSRIDDFPEEADSAIITKLHTKQPVLDILLTGPMNDVSLKVFAEELRDRLMESDDIADVILQGFSDRLLRVEVSREAMLRYGLSTVQVVNAVENQSVDLPAGKIEAEETFSVRMQENRKDPTSLENIVVSGSPGGAEVRLKDIATISDEFELEEDIVTVDGNRSALLNVMKSKAGDTIKAATEAKRILEELKDHHPQISTFIVNDQSELVEDRIGLLVKNGVQGCILVFFVMWLFFNARLSFWVVFSLPVSFLAAFAMVPSFGLTINMLTMVGMLMALGLLMDDGIVIAENIARRRSQGEPAMQAAIKGVKEVSTGVFSSFLTTTIMLGPLIFLNGELGRVLKVLPMMLLLVLATSLVEAFFILPNHLGHSLVDSPRRQNRFRKLTEWLIKIGRNGIARLVQWTVKWRYLTAGLVAMFFLSTISLILGGFVQGEVFPQLEGDTIVARVLTPPGTPLKETKKIVANMESALHKTNDHFRPLQPNGQNLVATTFVRFNENADAQESGTHVATIQADLLTNEKRVGRITEITSKWKELLGDQPGAAKLTFDEPSIGPAGRNIEIQLSGLPIEKLDEVSEEIQDYLQTFDGVYNINDDLRRGEVDLLINLRPGAVGLGVTSQDLARQLRGSFQGTVANQFQIGSEAYDVEIRFQKADRNSLDDLHSYLMSLPDGQKVPLSDIATIQRKRNWSRIAHFDGKQVVSVFGDVDSFKTNTMAVLDTLRKEKFPQLKEKFPSLNMVYKGEAEKGAETGQSMGLAALIGCLGVFVILSFQFRSYIEPAIVMIAIPFAFVGVVWGHWFFGINISLPSIMGYLSLAGIVVNDSILLVLFLKAKREEGLAVKDAASEASKTRFRAVMLTSLTTIAGLLPLLLEKSMQAQVLIPIAVSICFGLMASTILVLLVIPPFYVLLDDLGWTAKQI